MGGLFLLGMDLVLEGARGEFEPGEGSFEAMRQGDAYRLGLEGGAGSFTYSLALRHIEEGFVNPANRGLTPGGRSDRDVVELSLVKGFARSRLQARLQHFAGGDGIGLPATVDGATTAHYLTDRLRPTGVPVTRLAQGVPIGGALDVLDDGTLAVARV